MGCQKHFFWGPRGVTRRVWCFHRRGRWILREQKIIPKPVTNHRIATVSTFCDTKLRKVLGCNRPLQADRSTWEWHGKPAPIHVQKKKVYNWGENLHPNLRGVKQTHRFLIGRGPPSMGKNWGFIPPLWSGAGTTPGASLVPPVVKIRMEKTPWFHCLGSDVPVNPWSGWINQWWSDVSGWVISPQYTSFICIG